MVLSLFGPRFAGFVMWLVPRVLFFQKIHEQTHERAERAKTGMVGEYCTVLYAMYFAFHRHETPTNHGEHERLHTQYLCTIKYSNFLRMRDRCAEPKQARGAAAQQPPERNEKREAAVVSAGGNGWLRSGTRAAT